ncbi:arginine--tRNA ligase [Spiroplasma endosymbiont of Aspidapion aeneum]|uniref:arginine--tRNA ligase n=1 Tax=Spiroplasma endosymbiont of Aspidapion aeneum TaxID=3066276 RepID=UPI00313D596F
MSYLINQIDKEFKKTIKIKNYDKKINYIISKNDDISRGFFSTNFALIYGKYENKNPVDVADDIVKHLLENNKIFSKIEVAKPGFINFWLKEEVISKFLSDAILKGLDFGKEDNSNYYFNIEIISANPTGWLHIGHARNGIVGDCFIRVLKHLGYRVKAEYYLNDAGNQINICAITIFYHYMKALGKEISPPTEMYGGDMYVELGGEFAKKYKEKYVNNKIDYEGNKIIDNEVNTFFREEAVRIFLTEIKKQIAEVGIKIEHYSSEKSMYDSNEIDRVLELCKSKNLSYEKDGALWLKTTKMGDDKDRVMIKKDGTYTYIVPDLASHSIRFKRENADIYINFWGADHHGYIPRLIAGITLMGYKKGLLEIDIIQMVRLIRDNKEVKISKRKGTAVWMKDVIEEIGIDALRYMLNSKSPSSHLDFDLDLILRKDASNPVYYVQYCVARCNQVLEKWNNNSSKVNNFSKLVHPKEIDLILHIDQFINTLHYARDQRAPNVLCDFAYGLAKRFHSYYGEITIICDDNELAAQRINLVRLVYNVMSICLNLIGVEVKNKM